MTERTITAVANYHCHVGENPLWNERDGRLYWRSDMGGELSASPIADDTAIYVASETTGAPTEPRRPGGALPGTRRRLEPTRS